MITGFISDDRAAPLCGEPGGLSRIGRGGAVERGEHEARAEFAVFGEDEIDAGVGAAVRDFRGVETTALSDGKIRGREAVRRVGGQGLRSGGRGDRADKISDRYGVLAVREMGELDARRIQSGLRGG